MEKLWMYWIIAGILLIIIEIFTPGFFTLLLGIACLITALCAWLQVPIYLQFIIFAIVALVLSIFVRPYLMTVFFRNHKEDETNVHALIGKIGMVTEDIDNSISRGSVKLGGETWRSVTKDDTKIEKGRKVIVKSIEGNKVIVEKFDSI